jgi:hypothetical protein
MSARELYALIVGEAGIDPRYFLHEMSSDEAADFLEGYRRRPRQAWECAREGWMLQIVNTEGREKTEIFPFAWDEKPKKKRVTKKQRDALRRKAEAIAAAMKQAKNGE